MTDTLDLPEEVKQALRENWDAHEDDYRDMENYEGSELVYEDAEIAVVADHSKAMLSHMLKDCEAPYQWVKGRMADVAQIHTQFDWDGPDPIVFPLD